MIRVPFPVATGAAALFCVAVIAPAARSAPPVPPLAPPAKVAPAVGGAAVKRPVKAPGKAPAKVRRAMKMPLRVCVPDISTIGPLGCYEPEGIEISFYGTCFGDGSAGYRLAYHTDGGSSLRTFGHTKWKDDLITFKLPKGSDLKPETEGDVGIVPKNSKSWVDKAPFVICAADGTMPGAPPSSPTGLKVRTAPGKPGIQPRGGKSLLKSALPKSRVGPGKKKPLALASPAMPMTGAAAPAATPSAPTLPAGGGGSAKKAMFGRKTPAAARPGAAAPRARAPGTSPVAPGVQRAIDELRMLEDMKKTEQGAGVSWDPSEYPGPAATYTDGIGFVEASGGLGLSGQTLTIDFVDAVVACPPEMAVKSAAIYAQGGGSNTLSWPTYSPGNRSVEARFSAVGLMRGDLMDDMHTCPEEPEVAERDHEEDVFFLIACHAADGSTPIPEQQVIIPFELRLRCYQTSRIRATAKSVKFRHECPPGFVVQGTGQQNWEGAAGWSEPRVCAKVQ